MTAGASAAACLPMGDAEAALPEARITSIRVYEGPTVMPLQIPLLQSSLVVMIDTDIGITGIGEGGTPDSLAPTAARLIGRNPFEITDEARGTRDAEYEGHSASHFYRAGYTRGFVKPGDRIAILIAPRHDGEDGGFIQAFTANGKTIGFGGLSPETGARQ
jgi:hypothetical protein